MNICCLNLCPVGLTTQVHSSILFSCPDEHGMGRGDSEVLALETWPARQGKAKTAARRPGRAWPGGRSRQRGARGARRPSWAAAQGGPGGAVRVGGAGRSSPQRQLAAQRQHRSWWQVLQITAAEQSFCLDNVGRAVVHKLDSSTTPAYTDNNPLSVSAFKDKRQPQKEERAVTEDSKTSDPRKVQTRTPGSDPGFTMGFFHLPQWAPPLLSLPATTNAIIISCEVAKHVPLKISDQYC